MDRDTAVLQLMQTRGLGTRTLSRVLSMAAKTGSSPEILVSSPTDELTQHYGLKSEIGRAIQLARNAAEELANELQRHNVRVLPVGSPEYPAHLQGVLGDTAPPVLFVHGNLSILNQQAIGFCGSRKASNKGLRVASDCARMFAEKHINVITGYAHGVDIAANRAALEAGGMTTLVLAEGILRFRAKREIAELLTNDNYVVVSEFLPRLGWLARNAMQRNRTIIGLTDAMIVIESGLTGGTFAAGETSLALRRPLFVVEYAEPESSAEGNRVLLQRGGKALRGDHNGLPKLENVFNALESNDSPQAQMPEPQYLFNPAEDTPSADIWAKI